MKKLCQECPEQKYCTEACLESIVAEDEVHMEEGDYLQDKYIPNPQPLTSYKESRLRDKKHPWARQSNDMA